MFKRFFTISLLVALVFATNVFSQEFVRGQDVSPNLLPEEIKPNYPTIEAIWDVEFNYDATTVTLAAGNAGAVYIPTINKFWTSRWATGVAHQWNADGTLDLEFTLPFTGTRGMCFDGQFVYHSTSTTTVQIVDPTTRTVVGTIPVTGAPNGFRFITYNPDGNAGAGSIIGGNWTAPNLNFYEFSLTGTLLRTITSTVTGVYGMAYDNWSPGGPFLWVWGQGAGAGTPQFIQQMDYTAGTYTGVQHDVTTDVGLGNASAIAGGMFITEDLVTGKVVMGGMLQGTPDRLFGYELTTTGPPCPVQPATNPTPASGTTGVDINAPGNATWTNGAGTNNVEVFFGPAGNVVSVYSGAPITSLTIPTPLQYATTYQWRVVCKNDSCSGSPVETWSFTTIPDPLLFTWVDDFEAGPGNWTITNEGGTIVWEIFNPPYPNAYTIPSVSGGVFAADVDNGGSTATCLSTATITAPFDFSIYLNVWIEFDNDWQAIDADDFGYVEVSTDGTTWTTVKTFDVVDVRNTHENINISTQAALQPVVYVRLRTVQPGWDWWWAVDNFTMHADQIVPVELQSFSASVDVNSVSLNWSTATETNNSGFQIERSSGSEFENVGFVAGHGTTTEIQNYAFVDQNVVAGTYTYRLKQVDFNGTFEYSNTIEVDVIGIKEFALDQNYPNPFNPSTTINFSLAVDSKVSLKIFDVLGQEVVTLINGQLTAGPQKAAFDASSLNSGVYFYRIDASGIDGQKFSSTKKMILTK